MEVSVRYPESGATKEVIVNYDRPKNGCDLLGSRENRGVSSFDKESVNIVGGMNV